MWILPVKGTAQALEGGGTLGADGSLSGTLVVDAASIDTKNKKRDDHLRTADFFEVAKFPTITFNATSGRALVKGGFEVIGSLTVHGETRPLTFLADVKVTGDTAVVSAEVLVNRSQWGLNLTPFGAGIQNRVVLNLHFNKV
jgi:polyisoprenoid-binding protein YceI